MRADLIRIYKSVHTWTGIIAGLALFIAFYAGAITIFKEPLARWASPPSANAMLPLEQAPTLITRALEAHPEVAKDFRIYLIDSEQIPARMTWEIAPERSDGHDRSGVRYFQATLDDAGDLDSGETHPSELAEFIDVLHRVVGLPVDSEANRLIMGVIAALYSIALISGVVILLPTLIKDFFALRLGKNLKRMWLDAHNVVGIVSLPFHLVMALTSVIFAFHDGIYFLQDKLVHEQGLEAAFQTGAAQPGSTPPAPRRPSDLLPPAELVARAEALSPTFVPRGLEYRGVNGPRAMVRVWGHDETALLPRAIGGFVALDPYTGKVLNSDYLPGRMDAPNAVIASFFGLHMATFGGTAVHWMYFVLGLAGAWLFYSGNLLWVETRRRRQTRRDPSLPVQRRDTRLMAAGTVGVCLGSVAGISLTIVAAKWLAGRVEDLAAWHHYVYYGVFFGALAWAFWRGAARASVELLWVAAAFTAAIPLTSLIAAVLPSLGMWSHASSGTLAVDLTALAGAVCFAVMARATARRVRHGTPDSVWSGAAVSAVSAASAAPAGGAAGGATAAAGRGVVGRSDRPGVSAGGGGDPVGAAGQES